MRCGMWSGCREAASCGGQGTGSSVTRVGAAPAAPSKGWEQRQSLPAVGAPLLVSHPGSLAGAMAAASAPPAALEQPCSCWASGPPDGAGWHEKTWRSWRRSGTQAWMPGCWPHAAQCIL